MNKEYEGAQLHKRQMRRGAKCRRDGMMLHLQAAILNRKLLGARTDIEGVISQTRTQSHTWFMHYTTLRERERERERDRQVDTHTCTHTYMYTHARTRASRNPARSTHTHACAFFLSFFLFTY